MRAIKYRELKRMYDLERSGEDRVALAGGPASRRAEARGFQHSGTGRSDAEPGRGAADGPPPGRRLPAGGGRRRGRDGLLEHHRPGRSGQDLGGVHPGGLRPLPTGRHDSYAARRRADSGHRPGERRSGRSAARDAVSQPGFRRGLHRNPADHEARLHRAGHQRGDLLRPHAPDPPARRGGRRSVGPEQGEAAARPAGRHRQQLQMEGRRLQHLQQRRHRHGPGRKLAQRIDRGTCRLDRHRRRGATVRRDSRSQHGRAGADSRRPPSW